MFELSVGCYLIVFCRVAKTFFNKKIYYLRQWNDVRNGVKEELVPVLGAELRQREAQDVKDVVEEIVDGQRTHQGMEVSHHLKN